MWLFFFMKCIEETTAKDVDGGGGSFESADDVHGKKSVQVGFDLAS